MPENLNHKRSTARIGDAEDDLWLYTKRLTGLTLDQLRALAALPVEAGGLGKTYSVATIWRRIEARRKERLELLGSTVDGDRLSQLEKIDHVEYRFRELAAPMQTYTDEDGVEHTFPTPWQQVKAGLDGVLSCVRERAKLLGLDAPIKVAQTIERIDNLDLELRAMVAAADAKAAGGA